MLIAAIPGYLQLISVILGSVVAAGGIIGAIAGAIYIVKSRKIETNNTLADQAINSMTAANLALSSRLDLVEKDNTHCLELKKQQDIVIDQQNKRINDLREDVSQRAAVSEFRNEARGFLTAIADKLAIPSGEHPSLLPPGK